MAHKKWIMKQYWRVSEIRVLASLGMGMLVIGKLYVEFVPILQDWGVFGSLTLGASLFGLFLFLGWIYDTRIRMWSQQNQAIIERQAYYYVPMTSTLAFEYPILYTMIQTLNGVSEKLGIPKHALERLTKYLQDYMMLPAEKDAIDYTIESSEDFLRNCPFSDEGDEEKKSIPFTSKIKLAWEVQILRLTWIQSLTGLFQDVLIFGILYVFIIFPFASDDNAALFAIVGISMPLLVVLVALGWIYDKKLRVWSADSAVKIERNPYSYVLEPAQLSFSIPFFYSLLDTLFKTLRSQGLDTSGVERIIRFLNQYVTLESSRDEDLIAARNLRSSVGSLFMEENEDGS